MKQKVITSRFMAYLAVAALCLLVAGQFLAQDRCLDVALAMIDRGSLLAWAALALVAALSFGSALLRWLNLRPAGHGATAVFGTGIGLLAISLLTFLLGMAGLGGKLRYLLVLLAMIVLGMRDLALLLRFIAPAFRRARRASWLQVALWAVMGFFLLIGLTRAFATPWEYDDLEYHLAAPLAWHTEGRVFFIRNNVYTNFPQDMEMLFLLGMDLTESPDRGAVVGQLLGLAFLFLTAMALREMLRRLARRPAGDLAAAVFMAWPGVAWYAGLSHVEPALLFYATLALWGLLWSWRRRRSEPRAFRWVVLAGIAAGGAMGVKYTGALFVFIPVLLWLAALGALARVPAREVLKRMAVFAAVAILCVGPWLVRNAANTHNPVYPLLYGVFGSSNWDAQKDARWKPAHAAHDLSAGNFVAQVNEVLFVDGEEHNEMASLLLVASLPLILLAGRWTRGPAWLLLGHAALLYVLWFFFTHQAARFYEIAYPALAAVAGIGLRALIAGRVIPGVPALVVLLLLFQPGNWVTYAHFQRTLPVALGLSTPEPAKLGAMGFINDEKNLPAGSKVLFVGEARTFYCRRPVVASTVFDTNALEEIVRAAKTPEDILAALQTQAITHLYVNFGELRRLQTSYRYLHNGREHLGMLDSFNWPLFAQFARAHLRALYASPPDAPADRFPWERWPEFLRLPEADAKSMDFVAVYEVK